MAQDIFLNLAGIDGESTDNSHKNDIDVLGWSWAISQDSDMHSGKGGGAGKATVAGLTIEHFVDRASPNLMKYCLTGQPIPVAELVVRKAGKSPLEYLKLTMSDVLITDITLACDNENVRVREHVTLSFSKIKQEYAEQNADGGRGSAVTATFDIKGNKEE